MRRQLASKSVTIRLVITLGSGIHALSDTEEVLNDLATGLRDAETEARVVLSAPEVYEGYYRFIPGEVVVVYVAGKLIDALTEQARDAHLARITRVAERWARQRVQREVELASKHPLLTIVETRSEEGDQIGPSVKAEVTSSGHIEVTVTPKDEAVRFRRPVEFDASWLEGAESATDEGGGEADG